MLILLWILVLSSLSWIFYAYIGYPFILFLLYKLSPKPILKAEICPTISIIIPVHNGEKFIREKIHNTLSLNYPIFPQIIISSDNSSDETIKIAQEMQTDIIHILDNKQHQGKEAAQDAALKIATGEIVIFTDISTELQNDALLEIVKPFADNAVACVSSEDDVDTHQGEGLYIKYEMAIRRMESLATSLIGLSGSFFAVRRSLIKEWPYHLDSDFRSALDAIKNNSRAVVEPKALAKIKVTPNLAKEWQRKVRTICRGITVLFAYKQLLNPRYGRAAFSLWGHKVFRFTTPFAMLILFFSCLWGAYYSFWLQIILVSQVVFYSIGVISLLYKPCNKFILAKLSGFFLLVNASILMAWYYYLKGVQIVTWSPTQR